MQQPFPSHLHLQLVAYLCWISLLAISTGSAPLGKVFVLFNYLIVILGIEFMFILNWDDHVYINFWMWVRGIEGYY